MSDSDAQAAARWMLAQIMDSRSHELWQTDAAEHIKKNFDAHLTYMNANGNLAISKKVLDAFRMISDGTVVWEKGPKCWRQRTQLDPAGKRQVG
ncbi:hypothetical protein ABZ746_02270 [Streptomyces sp. NPDC020096]